MKETIFQMPCSHKESTTELFDSLKEIFEGRGADLPVTDLSEILQICKWILYVHVQGHSKMTIEKGLTEKLGISLVETRKLMNLAEVTGEELANTTDALNDPSDAVERMMQRGFDKKLSEGLVNMSLTFFHDMIEKSEVEGGAALGVDNQSAAAYFAAADYVLDGFDAGRDRELIAQKLVEKNIFSSDVVIGFIDEVLLAREASDRIDAGEEGTVVFELLDLQNRSPYVMMLALRLSDK